MPLVLRRANVAPATVIDGDHRATIRSRDLGSGNWDRQRPRLYAAFIGLGGEPDPMALVDSADGVAQCPPAIGFPSGRAPRLQRRGFPLGEIALDRAAVRRLSFI
jgi:hypothetical protein